MKRLAALLLLAFALPAVATGLSLRSEVPISAPEFGLSGSIGRADARIATNGHEYLAVWTDTREGGAPSLYAARLRADGTVIDPLGFRIVNGAHAGPVVWTGDKYLIAYETEPDKRSYVRTMTSDGVFGEPIAVGRDASWASMATNGTNVLLVLPKEAMLLDLEGNRLRAVPLAKIGYGYFYSRVAAAGSRYLVATAFPQVVIQAVSTDGVVGAPLTLAETTQYTRLDVASDGERFLVVWPDKRIYAQLVTADGTPTGPVQKLAYTPNANDPNVEWRDGEYLVIFSERHEVMHYAIRVAADGTLLGEPKRLGHDYVSDVDIATQGSSGIAFFAGKRAAVFDDASVEGSDVFRRIVDVGVTAAPQVNVRLARLGDGYVAAWAEGNGIRLSRAAGSTPVLVTGSNGSLIDVLVDRSNIIWVLWVTDGRTVALSRFRENLEPVDPAPIHIRTDGWLASGAAAAGDGVIALAYEVGNDITFPGPPVHDVVALLLWETGTGIARKDVVLTSQQYPDFSPTVTFDGSAFVYGWLHAKGEFPEYNDPPVADPVIELVGARVTPNGTLLDASPVHIGDDTGWDTQIKAALGAGGVAFAWQNVDKSTRVALFGGTPIDLGGPWRSLGELAPHQGGFLLVRGISRKTPQLTEVEYLVLGADLSITATGTLPPFPADGFFKLFDVDAIGGDTPVFAYAKSANSVYGNVSRVFMRATGEPRRRRVIR